MPAIARGRKGSINKERDVGHRVRLRRMIVGMSQEKLGDALGITFQQVQKYEKGTNRISATRLEEIAETLGVPVTHFYGGTSEQGGRSGGFAESGAPYVADLPFTSEGVNLIRAFTRIRDARIRRRILALVKTLGEDPPD